MGTGIKQLRENIAESKLSYEIMDDAAQAFLKTKIMDNIQKYFYLICFCAYLRDQSSSAQSTADEEQKKNFALTGGKGKSYGTFLQVSTAFNATSQIFIFFAVSTPTENLKISKKFVDWMNEKSNLRTICEEGKGKCNAKINLRKNYYINFILIGKLQWERDIPQDALDNLQNLANTDFKKNLGKIIHDIYLTGHNLFKDMPQGT